MRFEAFIAELNKKKIDFLTDAPMNKHTTFKIGGNADIYIKPCSIEQLVFALKKAKEYSVPYFILGNGSNILVSDDGMEGAVIDMQGINGIKVEGNTITCKAGESLRTLCIAARDASLSGMEFAYGIPGSVGGAFFMNAGAYGGEISQVAESAVCLDRDFNTVEITAEEMQLGYRKSIFQKNGMIIVSVRVSLTTGNKEEITARMNDIFARRIAKQPLDYPSAGSTFKRPDGYYAGTLIEESGLKGATVGGACVSEKHAGFIINCGNATAKNVLELIEKVRKTVKEKSGVNLEPEVLFVGRGE